MGKKETEKKKTAKRREGENRFIEDKAAAARRFGDVARVGDVAPGDVGDVGVGREVAVVSEVGARLGVAGLDKAAAARRFGDVAREGDVGEVGVGREVIMEGGLLLVSCVCVRPRGESAKAGEDCG